MIYYDYLKKKGNSNNNNSNNNINTYSWLFKNSMVMIKYY